MSIVEDEVVVVIFVFNFEKEFYFDEGIYFELEDSGEEDVMFFW